MSSKIWDIVRVSKKTHTIEFKTKKHCNDT